MIVLAIIGIVVVLAAIAMTLFMMMSRGDAAPPSMSSAPPPADTMAPPPADTLKQSAQTLETESGAALEQPLVVTEAGARRVSCPAACALEAKCGLRDRAACLSSSCDPKTDNRVRILNRADFCVADAASCADAVVCTCEESCWRRGECAGDHADDARCASTCAKLATQTPTPIYVENRCVLESACADIAACGGTR